jgi:hypothetical protein
MAVLALLVALVSGQSAASVSSSEFQLLGRLWLGETIAIAATSCVNTPDDKARLDLKLNTRGEVSISFRSVSSPRVRDCLEHLAQPARTFSRDAEAAQLTMVVPERAEPEGTIVCEIPPRAAKESGAICKNHQDCGAGQICIGPRLADGGSPARHCLDLQRWLVAQSR